MCRTLDLLLCGRSMTWFVRDHREACWKVLALLLMNNMVKSLVLCSSWPLPVWVGNVHMCPSPRKVERKRQLSYGGSLLSLFISESFMSPGQRGHDHQGVKGMPTGDRGGGEDGDAKVRVWRQCPRGAWPGVWTWDLERVLKPCFPHYKTGMTPPNT